MQSRDRTRRRKTEKNGLAVPIALTALVILGVLVTGMFYSLSREPDLAGPGKPYVGQTAAPDAEVGLQESQDSIAADSLTVLPDTTAAVGAMRPAPSSMNPLVPPPVLRRSAVDALPAPASSDPGIAGVSGTPRDG